MLLAQSNSGRIFGVVVVLSFGTILAVLHLTVGSLGGGYVVLGLIIAFGLFFIILNPRTQIYGTDDSIIFREITTFKKNEGILPISQIETVVLGVLPSNQSGGPGPKFILCCYKGREMLRRDDMSNFLHALAPIQKHIQERKDSVRFATYRLDAPCDMNQLSFDHLEVYSASALVINKNEPNK